MLLGERERERWKGLWLEREEKDGKNKKDSNRFPPHSEIRSRSPSSEESISSFLSMRAQQKKWRGKSIVDHSRRKDYAKEGREK